MANTTTSTNMSLPIPTVGEDAGPDWASNINASLTIIDAHDHSTGNGVRITPSGININADLPFGGYSATTLLKTSFSSQSAALTGTNFCSVIGGNLYFNDSSGNQIPITSGGGVAGSPGSIGSLTSPAAATYSAGSKLFTWTADSAKAAAMDNGAVTIRETNVASAKGVTIQSASSLAADYSLTLPAALPASTMYMTSSSLGVLSFSSANTIAAAMTSTGANAIAAVVTRSTGTTVSAGGVAISADSGNVTVSSTSYVATTNLSVTITTSGRPVFVGLTSINASGGGYVSVSTNQTSNVSISIGLFRNGGVNPVFSQVLVLDNTNGLTTSVGVPPGSFYWIDAVAAGTYTYVIKALLSTTTGTSGQVLDTSLIAYEL